MTEEVFFDPQVCQPAIVFLQIGLYHVWVQHHKIKPNVIVGHSIGEVSSAYACGALSLEDAVLVVYQRSFHQASIPSDIQLYLRITYHLY